MSCPPTVVSRYAFTRYRSSLCSNPTCGAIIPPAVSGQIVQTICEQCQIANSHERNRKRKRDLDDIGLPPAGPSNIDRALKKAVENEATATNGPVFQMPIQYQDQVHLISALRDCVEKGHPVDFAGSLNMHDPVMTHKQRTQALTHDIWKATGYRFIVKDYPRIKNGHKTRLCCSQDEAYSKTKVPGPNTSRIPASGETLGKLRYPCRSRLFISSRDTDTPDYYTIMVRLHHHVAHEPYFDPSLPPDITRSIWESMGWVQQTRTASGPAADPVDTMDGASDDDEHDDDGEEEEEESVNPVGPPGPSQSNGELKRHSETGATHLLGPKEFQERMRKHIAAIRDFCDGLEYQLQFNDYRMLNTLETEGGSFLRLVQDCLRKEGRLELEPGLHALQHADIGLTHEVDRSPASENSTSPAAAEDTE